MTLQYKQPKVLFRFGGAVHDVSGWCPSPYTVTQQYNDANGQINYGKLNISLNDDGRFSPDSKDFLFSGLGDGATKLEVEVYSNEKILWRGYTYAQPSFERSISGSSYHKKAVFSFRHRIELLKEYLFSITGDSNGLVPSYVPPKQVVEAIAKVLSYEVDGTDPVIHTGQDFAANWWGLRDLALAASAGAHCVLEHDGDWYGFDGKSVNKYSVAKTEKLFDLPDGYTVGKLWWQGGLCGIAIRKCQSWEEQNEENQSFIFRDNATPLCEFKNLVHNDFVRHKANPVYMVKRLHGDDDDDVNAVMAYGYTIGAIDPFSQYSHEQVNWGGWQESRLLVQLERYIAEGVLGEDYWLTDQVHWAGSRVSWGTKAWGEVLNGNRQDFLDGVGYNRDPIMFSFGSGRVKSPEFPPIAALGTPLYIPYPAAPVLEHFSNTGLTETTVKCCSVDAPSRPTIYMTPQRPDLGRGFYSTLASIAGTNKLLSGYWSFASAFSGIQINYTADEWEHMLDIRWRRGSFPWLNIEQSNHEQNYAVCLPPSQSFVDVVPDDSDPDKVIVSVVDTEGFKVLAFDFGTEEIEELFPKWVATCPLTGTNLDTHPIASGKVLGLDDYIVSYHPPYEADHAGTASLYGAVVRFKTSNPEVLIDGRDEAYPTAYEVLDALETDAGSLYVAVRKYQMSLSKVGTIKRCAYLYDRAVGDHEQRESSAYFGDPYPASTSGEFRRDYYGTAIEVWGDVTANISTGDFITFNQATKHRTFFEVTKVQLGYNDFSPGNTRIEVRPYYELRHLSRFPADTENAVSTGRNVLTPPEIDWEKLHSKGEWDEDFMQVFKISGETIQTTEVYRDGSLLWTNTGSTDKTNSVAVEYEDVEVRREGGDVYFELARKYEGNLKIYSELEVDLSDLPYTVENALDSESAITKAYVNLPPKTKLKVQYDYYIEGGSANLVVDEKSVFVVAAQSDGGLAIYNTANGQLVDKVSHKATSSSHIQKDAEGNWYGVHNHGNRVWRRKKNYTGFVGNLQGLKSNDCFSVLQRIATAFDYTVRIAEDEGKLYFLPRRTADINSFRPTAAYIDRGQTQQRKTGLFTFKWAGGEIPMVRDTSKVSSVKHMKTASKGNTLIDSYGWAGLMAELELKRMLGTIKTRNYSLHGIQDDLIITEGGVFSLKFNFKKQTTEAGVFYE